MKIDEEDHRTKLVIPACTREHNGKFVIKAENTAGKDEVTIEVTVLGEYKDYWSVRVLGHLSI